MQLHMNTTKYILLESFWLLSFEFYIMCWNRIILKWYLFYEQIISNRMPQLMIQTWEHNCKVVPVIYSLGIGAWRCMRRWRNSSTFLDLDSRQRWLVSFTNRLSYLHGHSFWYSVDIRLVGPHSVAGQGAEEKISCTAPIQHQSFLSYTELSQATYKMCIWFVLIPPRL
jgi:hypothetical protein